MLILPTHLLYPSLANFYKQSVTMIQSFNRYTSRLNNWCAVRYLAE